MFLLMAAIVSTLSVYSHIIYTSLNLRMQMFYLSWIIKVSYTSFWKPFLSAVSIMTFCCDCYFVYKLINMLINLIEICVLDCSWTFNTILFTITFFSFVWFKEWKAFVRSARSRLVQTITTAAIINTSHIFLTVNNINQITTSLVGRLTDVILEVVQKEQKLNEFFSQIPLITATCHLKVIRVVLLIDHNNHLSILSWQWWQMPFSLTYSLLRLNTTSQSLICRWTVMLLHCMLTRITLQHGWQSFHYGCFQQPDSFTWFGCSNMRRIVPFIKHFMTASHRPNHWKQLFSWSFPSQDDSSIWKSWFWINVLPFFPLKISPGRFSFALFSFLCCYLGMSSVQHIFEKSTETMIERKRKRGNRRLLVVVHVRARALAQISQQPGSG